MKYQTTQNRRAMVLDKKYIKWESKCECWTRRRSRGWQWRDSTWSGRRACPGPSPPPCSGSRSAGASGRSSESSKLRGGGGWGSERNSANAKLPDCILSLLARCGKRLGWFMFWEKYFECSDEIPLFHIGFTTWPELDGSFDQYIISLTFPPENFPN